MLNQAEEQFYNLMKQKGIELIPQKLIKIKHGNILIRYRPDFYDPKTDTFYEVIRTHQAFHMHEKQIYLMLKKGYKIKVVKPDGSLYKPFLKLKEKGVKLYFGQLGNWLEKNNLSPKDLTYFLRITPQLVYSFLVKRRRPSLNLAWEIEKLTKGEVPMESWIE